MKADIVVDIETIANPVTSKELQDYMATLPPVPTVDQLLAEYAPPSNYKDPEKIAKHRVDAEAKAVQKVKDLQREREQAQTNAVTIIQDKRRFKVGGARMISCALGVADLYSGKVTQIEAKSGDDLAEICKFIAEYLNEFSERRLVGFNHLNFDFPLIRKSFQVTGTPPPRAKFGKWDLVDLGREYKGHGGLKEVAVAFGFEIPEIDGSAVAGLYERGDWESIEKYNKHDVLITGQLHLATASWVAY